MLAGCVCVCRLWRFEQPLHLCVCASLLPVHYKSARSVVDALGMFAQNRPAHAHCCPYGSRALGMHHRVCSASLEHSRTIGSAGPPVRHAGEGWSVLAAHLLATLMLPCSVSCPTSGWRDHGPHPAACCMQLVARGMSFGGGSGGGEAEMHCCFTPWFCWACSFCSSLLQLW